METIENPSASNADMNPETEKSYFLTSERHNFGIELYVYRSSQQALDGKAKLEFCCQNFRQIEGRSALLRMDVNKV